MMRTSECFLTLLWMIIPNSNSWICTWRCKDPIFQKDKIKDWTCMSTESQFCFISFKSKPFNCIVTACSKNVFVLYNNESIDGCFVIIKVATIVLHFLFVIPNCEWSIVFVEYDEVVSIKLTDLSNIFVKTFQSVNYFRGLPVPHIKSTIKRSRCKVPIMKFEYLSDGMCMSLKHSKYLSLNRIPNPNCAV